MMAVFEGCQIVLDLTTSVRFKEKTNLRKAITSHGGVVSFIVTKKSTHVICNDPEKAENSYKCRMGLKYGIPVVSMDFVWKSVDSGQLQSTDTYLVAGQSKSDGLKEGKIAATRYQKREKKKEIKPYVNVGSIQVWKEQDKNRPGFALRAQLAKFAMFQGEKRVKNKEESVFAVLEVHVDETFSNSNSSCDYKYRVVSHTGTLHSVERREKGCFEYRFCASVDEALAVYSSLYEEQQQQGMRVVQNVFSRHIGSSIFKQMMGELGLEVGTMTAPVEELVEHVWREAQGELDLVLSIPVVSIKMEQIEKAEAVLKQLKVALDNEEKAKIPKLMQDFYTSLPHHEKIMTPTKAWLSRKQDICQLVKDMKSVSEATDWSTLSSIQSKYKALRCGIHHLHRTSPEYLSVKQQILDSVIGNAHIEVRNIFAVNRPVETTNFTSHLSPKQLMFHASKADNMVGILSRGLLMPRVVVDDHGGTRSDPGMLGAGIYFASAASTSIGYSLPSSTKGSRFMLVNEVALGNCKDVYNKDLTLTSAPEGYDSVHGVRHSKHTSSDFKNDEYVIYQTNQQCIRYLVEFTTPMDIYLPIEDMPVKLTMEEMEENMEDNKQINLKDVRDIQDPLTKVQPGLVATGDAAVNLKAVHIRVKLVDLASEVIVLQHYENNSKTAVEAKYVFPLGDMAAVCGFEAFINGKHIVGEVKEKETAHKEYKKAISEGHGAYLMDQDEETPDVFTVSVGNLPAGACVLIKITYVAELQVEGEMISFRLPGSVAPWQKDSLKDVTQQDTDTHEVEQGETTVQVAVDMPFDIRTLECSTHKIRMKKTLTKATVELLPDQSIADGFQLLIGLAEIHVPRMWVERKAGNQDHQACMLTFYPQFEACETEDVNVILLLDLSNSMKGDNLVNAKKVVLLTLEHLPASWNFNIVVFGTAFKELFPVCVRKTASNVKMASEFVVSLTADLGNTEVVRPMHTFYLLKLESCVQNVFLVSDGHINNEEVMLTAANKNSQHTRLFTMGVSSTANRHALRALARVGAGAYEYFDAKVKSKWEAKVKSHINKAAQPGLTSVTVDWEQHGADVAAPVQAPKQITALFSGSRQVIYGFVPNCTIATLRATIAGEEVSTLVSTSDLSITQGLILHRLTARAMISDWEDGVLAPDRTDHEIVKMNTKDYIIELSKEFSIVTQFTSFVAIEKRDEDEEKRAVDAPSMSELVEKENVDQLTYMGYEEEQISEVDADRTVDDILTNIRLNFSSKLRQRDCIEEGLAMADLIKDVEERNRKIGQLERAFDEWELDEDFDFTSEFARKRQTFPEKKNIEVLVTSLTGRTEHVAINMLNTFGELKARAKAVQGREPDEEIRLVPTGGSMLMKDEDTLEECNIHDLTTLYLLNVLRGGGGGGGGKFMRSDEEDEDDEVYERIQTVSQRHTPYGWDPYPTPYGHRARPLGKSLVGLATKSIRVQQQRSSSSSSSSSGESDAGSDFSNASSGDSGSVEGEEEEVRHSRAKRHVSSDSDSESSSDLCEEEEKGGKGGKKKARRSPSSLPEEDDESSTECAIYKSLPRPVVMEKRRRTRGLAKEKNTVAYVLNEIEETKTVMRQNIETVLDRGEKIDDLVQKSDELQMQSQTFYKTTVHRKIPVFSKKSEDKMEMMNLYDDSGSYGGGLEKQATAPMEVYEEEEEEDDMGYGLFDYCEEEICEAISQPIEQIEEDAELEKEYQELMEECIDVPTSVRSYELPLTQKQQDVWDDYELLSEISMTEEAISQPIEQIEEDAELEKEYQELMEECIDVPTSVRSYELPLTQKQQDVWQEYKLLSEISMTEEPKVVHDLVSHADMELAPAREMKKKKKKASPLMAYSEVEEEPDISELLEDFGEPTLPPPPPVRSGISIGAPPPTPQSQRRFQFLCGTRPPTPQSQTMSGFLFGASPPPPPPPDRSGISFGAPPSPPPALAKSGFSFGAPLPPPPPPGGSGISFGAPPPPPPAHANSGFSFGAPPPPPPPPGGSGILFGAPPPPPPPHSRSRFTSGELLFGASVLPPAPSMAFAPAPMASPQPHVMPARGKSIKVSSNISSNARVALTCAPPPPAAPQPHFMPTGGVQTPSDSLSVSFMSRPAEFAKAAPDRDRRFTDSQQDYDPIPVTRAPRNNRGGGSSQVRSRDGIPPPVSQPPLPPVAEMAKRMGIKKTRSIQATSGVTEKSSTRASLLSDIRAKSQDRERKSTGETLGDEKSGPSLVGKGKAPEIRVSKKTHSSVKLMEKQKEQPTVSWRACESREEAPMLKRFAAPADKKGGVGVFLTSAICLRRRVLEDCIESDDDDDNDDDNDDGWAEEEREDSFIPLLAKTEEHPDLFIVDPPLYKYGIGLKIPSIVVAISKVTRSNASAFLLKLADARVWDLPVDLQKEMGIDLTICEQLLKQAGLPSLGTKVQEALYPLLKTWIIAIFLFKLFVPEKLPMDFGNEVMVVELGKEAILAMRKDGINDTLLENIFINFYDMCYPIDEKYGYLCNMLELGTSWYQLIANMYHVNAKIDENKRKDVDPVNRLHDAEFSRGLLQTV